MRRLIAGLVGGGLAAAVGTGLYGLVLQLLGGENLNAAAVQAGVLAGAGFGIVSAMVSDRLPNLFVVRVAVIFVVGIVGELVAGSASEMPALILGMASYAVVLAFVLHQVIELPLPVWKPARRADDFKDIRAELH